MPRALKSVSSFLLLNSLLLWERIPKTAASRRAFREVRLLLLLHPGSHGWTRSFRYEGWPQQFGQRYQPAPLASLARHLPRKSYPLRPSQRTLGTSGKPPVKPNLVGAAATRVGRAPCHGSASPSPS
ncbi:uncharacterized protein A4U43_C01F30340 [Asparagus officinalis]|uniref:Secreted protein n=1 Tax=Asparagus officinalis TaxID=4686 RepID=A0A5P1FV43_ASPOF|nr:uncharacterized protein A4U43_C01F30340 [Asparagus officinalis]